MHSNPDARERHAVRLGVAGAVLAFLALTTVQAVAIRPYLPPDELYHVGYAATVLDGRLPTLTTPLPTDRVPLAPDDGRPRRVYVANHPPLFYRSPPCPSGSASGSRPRGPGSWRPGCCRPRWPPPAWSWWPCWP